jgi:glucose-6-phosphate isomerase
VHLSFFNDHPRGATDSHFARFQRERVLERLQELDQRARRKGLAALHADQDPLIRIGMETDAQGRVTKNGYGVFNLSWQAAGRPEWADMIAREAAELRQAVKQAHGVPLRYLLWCGMGGSAEDKLMYQAAGLLRRGPRCYVLDSTDPAKLNGILEDIRRRDPRPLEDVLRRTLVVGMAMGMTSYEPVVNLEKLALLYERHGVPSRANFLYMTLPGSLLDGFAGPRGYRRVELQPDNANTTAGRHSGPLTRGSLYPLALAGVDLRAWIQAAVLEQADILTAWRLAAFIHAQGEAGRDKLTLLLPKSWSGAALWTKQDFEESLGKREDLGLKIVVGERPKLADYRAPRDPRQDRAFLAVQIRGEAHPEARKIAALRRAGYPLAVLTAPGGSWLSSYMQFIHYAVFGVAYLREMNFVTQPSVELYKAITAEIYAEARRSGGIRRTAAWREMFTTPRQIRSGRLTLYYHHLGAPSGGAASAAEAYAGLLAHYAGERRVSYAELTFFGDTRYDARGAAVRRVLQKGAGELFRARLKMPVDVYEGPAMNHSYHEMIIGHGSCFSTVLASARPAELPAIGYTADYHLAQFLATQIALARRGRPVVALLLDDLEEESLRGLQEFFHRAAACLKGAGRLAAVAAV